MENRIQAFEHATLFLITVKETVTPRIIQVFLEHQGILFSPNEVEEQLKILLADKKVSIYTITEACEKNPIVFKHYGVFEEGKVPEVISTVNTRLGENFFRRTKVHYNYDMKSENVQEDGIENILNTDIIVYHKQNKYPAISFSESESANKSNLLKFFAQKNNCKIMELKICIGRQYKKILKQSTEEVEC